MDSFPFAWAFFVPFIVVTTFAVLNLFIGIVVNAMQAEQEKVATEGSTAERDMIREETAPLVEEVKALRVEIAKLQLSIEPNDSAVVSGSQRAHGGL